MLEDTRVRVILVRVVEVVSALEVVLVLVLEVVEDCLLVVGVSTEEHTRDTRFPNSAIPSTEFGGASAPPQTERRVS